MSGTKKKPCQQRKRELHDGQADGLTPLESLNLSQVDNFPDLLRAMSKTAFSGRSLGEAYDIMLEMNRDPDCSNILTVSGAMTVAKQGKIICDLIDRGCVDAVVATGALITHGLTESIGLTHYKYEGNVPDEILCKQGYNRIYDTVEMTSNLNSIGELVWSVLKDTPPPGGAWSSSLLFREIGRRLDELDQGPGILRSAFRRNVPVFVPAFTDSELGLDVAVWATKELIASRNIQADQLSPEEMFEAVPSFNPYHDLQAYTRWAIAQKKLGIFTIGGGVPRNWAQQLAPYFDYVAESLGIEREVPRFRYGIRICPEPTHWGGLSGCTYSEGVSWGKFTPSNEGGRFAEVYADATVVLPLLVKAVFQTLDSDSLSDVQT